MNEWNVKIDSERIWMEKKTTATAFRKIIEISVRECCMCGVYNCTCMQMLTNVIFLSSFDSTLSNVVLELIKYGFWRVATNKARKVTGKAIKSKKKTIKFECSQARTIARKKQRCRSTHNLNMPFHCIRRKQLELHSRCLIAGFPKAPAASRTLLHPFNLLFFCFSSPPPLFSGFLSVSVSLFLYPFHSVFLSFHYSLTWFRLALSAVSMFLVHSIDLGNEIINILNIWGKYPFRLYSPKWNVSVCSDGRMIFSPVHITWPLTSIVTICMVLVSGTVICCKIIGIFMVHCVISCHCSTKTQFLPSIQFIAIKYPSTWRK